MKELEPLLTEFSDLLYQHYFKKEFTENQWELSVLSTKRGDKFKNVYYIGAGYEFAYFNIPKDKHKCFLLKVIENHLYSSETTYSVLFDCRGLSFDFEFEEHFAEVLVDFLSKKKIDILLSAEFNFSSKQYATGKNSKNILKMNQLIQKYLDEKWLEKTSRHLVFFHTDISFTFVENFSKGSFHLYKKNDAIKEVFSVKELDDWLKEQMNDLYQIKNIYYTCKKTLKEKINTEQVEINNFYGFFVDFTQKVNLYLGKETKGKTLYKLRFSSPSTKKEAMDFDSLEELKKEALNQVTKFAHSYRLRKLLKTE